MAHNAADVGLATAVLLEALLNELEAQHPGIRGRVIANAKATVASTQGPQTNDIAAVLNDL